MRTSTRPGAVEGLDELAGGVDARVVQAIERGRLGEVQPVRGGHVLLEHVALAAHRQEVEDPAAVVVEDHDREVEPELARGDEAADVVGERDVADSRTTGPPDAAATPNAVETVPSMPLAPRLDRTRGRGRPAGK